MKKGLSLGEYAESEHGSLQNLGDGDVDIDSVLKESRLSKIKRAAGGIGSKIKHAFLKDESEVARNVDVEYSPIEMRETVEKVDVGTVEDAYRRRYEEEKNKHLMRRLEKRAMEKAVHDADLEAARLELEHDGRGGVLGRFGRGVGRVKGVLGGIQKMARTIAPPGRYGRVSFGLGGVPSMWSGVKGSNMPSLRGGWGGKVPTLTSGIGSPRVQVAGKLNPSMNLLGGGVHVVGKRGVKFGLNPGQVDLSPKWGSQKFKKSTAHTPIMNVQSMGWNPNMKVLDNMMGTGKKRKGK